MTKAGFDKLIRYLEGAFRVKLAQHERDAYWLTLGPDDDAVTFERAIEYVRSERARFGFPKPGELIPQEISPIQDYHRPFKALPERMGPSQEEARELLGEMRQSLRPFPPDPRRGFSDRLRELRKRAPKPEDAA